MRCRWSKEKKRRWYIRRRKTCIEHSEETEEGIKLKMVEKGNIIRWKNKPQGFVPPSFLIFSTHSLASWHGLPSLDLIPVCFGWSRPHFLLILDSLTHSDSSLSHSWLIDSFLNHSWFMDSFLTHCWLILDSLLTHSDLPLNHSWLIDSFLTHYWITLDSLNHPWLTIDSSLTHYWLTLTHSWLIHSSLPHNRLLLTHLIPPRLTLDSLWLTLNSPIPDSLLTHYSSLAHTS